jgi:hypothetical protein
LGLGFDVVLASGAHGTYDQGSASAAAVSETIEKDLGNEGATVRLSDDIPFLSGH